MRRLRFLAITGMLVAAAASLCGQQSAAPLPAALSTAKKLFVGNAGDQENADCLRSYNIFYKGLEALHRFELVDDPGKADLIIELHYEIDLGGSIGSNDGRRSVRQFRAVLMAPNTGIVLWSLTERTNYAVFQKNRDKNLDETVGALVADFDSLTSAAPTPPNNKSRVTR